MQHVVLARSALGRLSRLALSIRPFLVRRNPVRALLIPLAILFISLAVTSGPETAHAAPPPTKTPAPKPTKAPTQTPTNTPQPTPTNTPLPTPLSAPCVTSSPSTGAYSVTLCITGPADGATITGDTPVTISINVTGTNPGVQRAVFYLDNQYLLTDFTTAYTFLIPSAKFVDGSHSLGAQLLMRDQFTTGTAFINLVFSNGVTQPPVNTNTFTPSSGTQPLAGQPYIVTAAGDGAGGEPSAENVTNLISSWNPNLFLYLGDVYEKGSPAEFYNWYRPSNYFGAFRSITNPVVGNHEYSGGSGAAGYFDFWNNVPHYYSYNLGSWHFIALDSTSQYGGTSTNSPQYTWLQSDLRNSNAACIIAYFHHPVYNIGPEGDTPAMNAIWALLAQYGTDIVLTGHDHDYQRWVPLDGTGSPSSTGITQFVVGTAGHGTQQFVRTDSRVAVAFDTPLQTFGALRLSLASAGANYAFVNTQGTILDSGTVPCGTQTSDTQAPTVPSGLQSIPGNAPVTLSWNASTDNVGVAGYDVYRNGTAIGMVSGAYTNVADTTAALNTSYTYTIDAFDAAGNHSGQSSPLAVTSASSETLMPTADTYVDQSLPTSNYGTATVLRADASPDLHAYVRLNVQNWAPGLIATLRLYANSNGSAGIDLHSVADNTWDPATMVYSNAPAYDPAVLGSTGSFVSGAWASINVTPLITGNGSYNFALTTSGSTTISLASSESGANAPQLVLQAQAATPTPTPTQFSTATPTWTATPTSAALPTSTPPLVPTDTPTATSAAPTATATSTATPVQVATATNTVAPTQTATPVPADTSTPTPTLAPTMTPTSTPNALPTMTPTATNTPVPATATPTMAPTTAPTATSTPTLAPTNTPTLAPTSTPTIAPTSTPASSTMMFTAAADTYVNSAYPTTNFGTGTSIREQATPELRGYVRFNVQNLSGTITKATLRIYANSGSSAGCSVSTVADNTWGETTMTYSNAPALTSPAIGPSGSFVSGNWISVDVTSAVKGNGTYSFGLTTTGSQINLASRETGTTAPQLIIQLGP